MDLPTVAVLYRDGIVGQGLVAQIEKDEAVNYIGFANNLEAGLELLQENAPKLTIVDVKLPPSGDVQAVLHPFNSFSQLNGSSPCPLFAVDDNYATQIGMHLSRLNNVHGYVALGGQHWTDYVGVLTGAKEIITGGTRFDGPIQQTLLQGVCGISSDPACILSDREFEVFLLYGAAMKPKDIAERLCLSVKTVHSHADRIKDKLDLGTSARLRHAANEYFLHGTFFTDEV